MNVRAFRITQTPFIADAFLGEGARLNGGRWNSPGTRMVYTAASLSLATLEMLVHVEDMRMLFGRFSVIPVDFDDSQVELLATSSLPKNWNTPVINPATQVLGDRWIISGSSPILQVPSAVTSTEFNYLLNPSHPKFAAITIGGAFPLALDPRLMVKK